MTKQEMMATVYRQLALDYNCQPEDFTRSGILFTEAKMQRGRRHYHPGGEVPGLRAKGRHRPHYRRAGLRRSSNRTGAEPAQRPGQRHGGGHQPVRRRVSPDPVYHRAGHAAGCAGTHHQNCHQHHPGKEKARLDRSGCPNGHHGRSVQSDSAHRKWAGGPKRTPRLPFSKTVSPCKKRKKDGTTLHGSVFCFAYGLTPPPR